jgi:hypothetical protein
MSHPSRFTSGKGPQYPLKRRLDGPQSWSGQFWSAEYLLRPPEFKIRIVQPVVTYHIDYATQAFHLQQAPRHISKKLQVNLVLCPRRL